MPCEHPAFPSLHHGYSVNLSERCDGWSITVTRAGRAAAFQVHHRDAQCALAMAKAVAVTEGSDLFVLTAMRRGYEFVPAPRVASYVLRFRSVPTGRARRATTRAEGCVEGPSDEVIDETVPVVAEPKLAEI